MSQPLRLGVRQLFENLALPLLPIVQELGLRGIPFHGPTREALVSKALARIGQLDLELFGAGLTMPNSPRALERDLLARGVPLTKRTPSGAQFVTDLDVLRRFHHHYNESGAAPKFPFLPALIERKKLEKARANLESLHPCTDGRIRTALRSTGTETGRYSSAGLRWCNRCRARDHGTNLQNIAKNNEELGVNVKDCFVAPPGWEFWELDYSMLELRIMAYVAGVSLLVERLEAWDAHTAGADDIHTLNTKALFDGRYSDALRVLAKNFFYALQYGGSEGAVQMALAKKGEYLEQAYILQLMHKIFREYPQIPLWQQEMGAMLGRAHQRNEPKIVRNAFGRCRVLLGAEPLKEALSTRIQGTAADIMSFVLVRLSPDLRSYLVAQIHDAYLGCSPVGMVSAHIAGVRAEMEREVWMGERFVRFPTDAKRGVVWSQLKGVEG